jgi:hypothetical protein
MRAHEKMAVFYDSHAERFEIISNAWNFLATNFKASEKYSGDLESKLKEVKLNDNAKKWYAVAFTEMCYEILKVLIALRYSPHKHNLAAQKLKLYTFSNQHPDYYVETETLQKLLVDLIEYETVVNLMFEIISPLTSDEDAKLKYLRLRNIKSVKTNVETFEHNVLLFKHKMKYVMHVAMVEDNTSFDTNLSDLVVNSTIQPMPQSRQQNDDDNVGDFIFKGFLSEDFLRDKQEQQPSSSASSSSVSSSSSASNRVRRETNDDFGSLEN